MSASDNAYVDHNTIKFNSICSFAAIKCTIFGSENEHIEHNIINFRTSSGAKGLGIYLLIGRTHGTTVSFNDINGKNYVTTDNSIGILNNGVSGMDRDDINGLEFCSNSTDSLGSGFLFVGKCDQSHLIQNIIKEHNIGLRIEDNQGIPGSFGVQSRNLNEWHGSATNGTYPVDAARYTAKLAFLDLSLYKYSDAAASSAILNPSLISNNVLPLTGWFKNENGSDETCGFQPIHGLTGFDSLIVNSNILFENLEDPVKFYLEKNVIGRIMEDVDLTYDWNSYLVSMEDETEYQLAKIELELKRALPINVSDNQEIDAILNDQKSTIGNIITYDAYNYAHVDSVTFTEATRLDSITAILSRCQDKIESIRSITDDNRSRLLSDLTDISDELNAVEPRAVYDEYYKEIDSLYLKKLIEGTLNSSDYELINKIAHDDEDSSFANVIAFELFNPCSDDEFPFNNAIHSSDSPVMSGLSIQNNGSQELKDQIEVFNNGGELLIKINDISGSTFNLYDLNGRRIFKQLLNVDPSLIKFSENIPAGLYFWIVTNSEKGYIYKSGIIPIIK
jgi:hypothetical protein